MTTPRITRTDMDDNALRALLGDFYPDTTPEQLAAIGQAYDQIGARWPDPDLADTRLDAMNAALEVILGDTRDEDVAGEWHRARARERVAHSRLTGAIIAGSIVAPEPETRQAERLHVTRVTLRKALGR